MRTVLKLVAVTVVLAVAEGRAAPPAAPEALWVSAQSALKGLQDVLRSKLARHPRGPIRTRAAAGKGEELPYHCPKYPVVYVRYDVLYRNGEQLGTYPRSFQATCTGDVLWMNSSGKLLRNRDVLGSAESYGVAVKTGDVAWREFGDTLYKNTVPLGKANDFQIGGHSGVVVWTSWYGVLHRDEQPLGRAQTHRVARYTGDVAWLDDFGRLYRNADPLGSAASFQVADKTGDVGWQDSYRRLYKNERFVTDDFESWELRADGLLVWRDRQGNLQSQ